MNDDPNTRPQEPDPPDVQLAIRATIVVLRDVRQRLRGHSKGPDDPAADDLLLRVLALLAVLKRLDAESAAT